MISTCSKISAAASAILLCIVSTALLSGCDSVTQLTLVAGGKAQATIIVPGAPSPAEQLAAENLVRLLERISGVRLSVEKEAGEPDADGAVISIGLTNLAVRTGIEKRLAPLPQDSFMVLAKPEKGAIFLAGNGDLGPSYAVSHFLESLGVRWFFPGESGTVVPQLRDITVDRLETVSAPDFPLRAIGGEREPEWSLFNRMNVNVSPGLGVKVQGHAHTFFRFLPPGKHFNDHPEWYSLVDGARRPRQLCTSNPEVIRALADAMIQAAKDAPAQSVITLFPQDGLGFCECAACKALDGHGKPTVQDINKNWRHLGPERYGALSRRMLTFYREVSRRVLAELPQASIMLGAYSAYLYPPAGKVEPFPEKVLLEICRGRDHNHPLSSDDSDFNVRLRKAIEGWRGIFSQLAVYEYYWKLSMIDLPFPILHTLAEDIRFYKARGVKSFYTQFGADFGSNGFLYYAATRLLWDSSQDVYSILDDFSRSFFGEAREPMRDYYLTFEKAAIDFGGTLAAPVWELPAIFTPDLLARQQQLLEQAGRQARTASVRERIANVQVSLDYVSMCMDYIRLAGKAARQEHAAEDLTKLDQMAWKIHQFRAAHADSGCFNHETAYIKRFLTPRSLIRQIAVAYRPI